MFKGTKSYLLILFLISFNCKCLKAQSFSSDMDYAFNRDLSDDAVFSYNNILLLKDQYVFFGLNITNNTSSDLSLSINLNGNNSCAVEMRKAIPLVTWYSKFGGTVLDPVLLLPKTASGWSLNLTDREHAKLLICVKTPNEPLSNGSFVIDIKNAKTNEEKKQMITYTILNKEQPKVSDYKHIAFTNIYNIDFSKMLADLNSAFVNILEYPIFPDVIFNADGSIKSVNWSKTDRYLINLKNYNQIKLMLFWQPYYKKFNLGNGTQVSYLSDQWFIAFKNILNAFIAHAATMGISQDRLNIEFFDEVHSTTLTPGKIDVTVADAQKVAKYMQAALPRVKQMNTFSNNSQLKDYQSIINYSNVVIQHWPMPQVSSLFKTRLNPSLENAKSIKPFLSQFKKRATNFESLNYHISKGKSDDILTDELLFPIFSIINGNNGVGWWAYNAYSGSSWNDKDGKNLDYSFIYNGKEPAAQEYFKDNYAKTEDIVPSIRWEAVKSGIQNALILKSLLNNKSLSQEQNIELQNILSKYKSFLDNEGNPKNNLSLKDEFQLSQSLIKLYGSVKN